MVLPIIQIATAITQVMAISRYSTVLNEFIQLPVEVAVCANSPVTEPVIMSAVRTRFLVFIVYDFLFIPELSVSNVEMDVISGYD